MMMMMMVENKWKSTGDCVGQESRRGAFCFHVQSSQEVSSYSQLLIPSIKIIFILIIVAIAIDRQQMCSL